MSPLDALFVLGEGRAHPMHVGSVLLFEPPADAGPGWVDTVWETLRADGPVHPLFRTRPHRIGGVGYPRWRVEPRVDLNSHVRRWGVPGAGSVADLFEVVSLLHAAVLDPDRPAWEVHLIEGLADGRIAVYAKMHHALADGVTAMHLLEQTLTTEHDRHRPPRAPWQQLRSLPTPDPASPRSRPSVLGLARPLRAAADLAPAAARVAWTALRLQHTPWPWQAPRTVLNTPVGGARRCTGRSWPLERVRQVAKSAGTTVNDVVLALAAGGLRGYLSERGALPGKPLIAMVPVSLHPSSTTSTAASGNQLAAVLCPLATDVADPLARLHAISAAMHDRKRLYRKMSPAEAMAASALLLTPAALTVLPGTAGRADPVFNLVISNVPGPRDPLYWHGARLDATYPMSIPIDGLALNITVTGTATSLDVGLTACRRTLPDIDRLLDHFDTTLAELENAS
ncbi:WS/DGAT/MGAT family O-acyltransferase [Nocardia yunnanensis]|nr:wax ester/triacylglycerol synthase family O-acyltransferase [Nocardia yunnanensis]